LCALATCTGYQVQSFLKQRGLSTEGAGLCIEAERNAEDHLLETVCMNIRVPKDFPEKYNDAIIRATGQCFIKQQLGQKPDFEVRVMPSRE
jgi:ribosomal protein S12 methylthiotransferase accessory factor